MNNGIHYNQDNGKTSTHHHILLHAQAEIHTYGIDAPYEEANYDPHAAQEFYKNKRIKSLSRLTQIAGKSSKFIADTILDTKLNREEEVRKKFGISNLCLCLPCYHHNM